MKIAIIPARGGSKRIKRKNIKDFNGKPMIAWAIQKALVSSCFDHVFVSTDDVEIKDVSLQHGALVPFMRPSSLSDDITPTVPVIAHAISQIEKMYSKIEYACCIYPCTPTLEINDLVNSLELLTKSQQSFIYPVSQYPHPIQRALRLSNSGKPSFINSEYELTRTQDLELTYHDTGMFYWGKRDAWIQQQKMHTDGLAFSIPSWRTCDIDTEEDWKRAEIITKFINQQ